MKKLHIVYDVSGSVHPWNASPATLVEIGRRILTDVLSTPYLIFEEWVLSNSLCPVSLSDTNTVVRGGTNIDEMINWIARKKLSGQVIFVCDDVYDRDDERLLEELEVIIVKGFTRQQEEENKSYVQ